MPSLPTRVHTPRDSAIARPSAGRALLVIALACAAWLAPRPALAAHHLMQIEQVIGGVEGDTSRQAIQLRMRASSQNFVSSARLRVWDATGSNPVLVANMSENVANGIAGRRVLLATSNFLAGLTPDFTIDRIPPAYLAAGRLTYEDDSGTVWWSLAWGGYTGSNLGAVGTNDDDGNFGPPFPQGLPTTGGVALQFQGAATAQSTSNAANYALTPGAATFVNNANQSGTVPATGGPLPNWLVAAVLPSSRSVQVGVAATAFATIINTGPATATTCGVALPPGLPATFAYQTTNSANQLVGTVNTPVDIAPGGAQSFVFAVTPTAPIAPVDVPLIFACANAAPAASIVGLDTLLLSASATPVPDIVALAATTGNDGIVHAPPSGGAFAVAAANVGVGGAITVTAEPGGNVPAVVTLCQTDLAGACLAPPTSAIQITIGAGQIPSFGVFVQPVGAFAFDPAVNRIFVRFREGGIVRGSTSVAVSPQ